MSHPEAATLSSLLTDLESLTARVVQIADAHRDDPDAPLAGQLDELERSLISAARRLERTIRTLA